MLLVFGPALLAAGIFEGYSTVDRSAPEDAAADATTGAEPPTEPEVTHPAATPTFTGHTTDVSLPDSPAGAPSLPAQETLVLSFSPESTPRLAVFSWDFDVRTQQSAVTPAEVQGHGRVALPAGLPTDRLIALHLCWDEACSSKSAPRYFSMRPTKKRRGIVESFISMRRHVVPLARGRAQVNHLRKLVVRLPETSDTEEFVSVRLKTDPTTIMRKIPIPCADSPDKPSALLHLPTQQPLNARKQARTAGAKSGIARPFRPEKQENAGANVSPQPYCATFELDAFEQGLQDIEHGEVVEFEVEWKDELGEGKEVEVSRRLRPVTPYGMFGKNWSFWIPVGVLATNFRPLSRRRGVPIELLPIGVASGAKVHLARDFYIGASVLAAWTVRPASESISTSGEGYPGGATEVEPSPTPGGGSVKFPEDDKKSTDTVRRFNVGALTVGAIMDIGNYVYIGGGYSWDWTADEHPAGVFIFGLGPGVLELLKKGRN